MKKAEARRTDEDFAEDEDAEDASDDAQAHRDNRHLTRERPLRLLVRPAIRSGDVMSFRARCAAALTGRRFRACH